MINNQELLNQLISLLEVHNHGEILKILKKQIKNSNIVYGEIPEIYEIIGELTKKDPNFFMVKIFPHLYKIHVKRYCKNFIFWWEKREIQDIDKHIIKNYCLHEGEKLIVKFLGYISPYNMDGMIYLTNYRMILNGIKPKSVSFSYAGLLINATIRAIGQKIRSTLANNIRKEISELNVGEWGYPVPLFNASNIQNNNKKITFLIKTDEKNIKFKIKPNKKVKKNILPRIEKLLLEHQEK